MNQRIVPLALSLCIFSSSAEAATVPIGGLTPSTSTSGVGPVQPTQVSPHLYIQTGVWLDFSQGLLRLVSTDEASNAITANLVSNRLALILQSSIGLNDNLSLSLGIPITHTAGSLPDPGVISNTMPQTGLGVGDLSLGAQLQLLNTSTSPVGIALALPVSLPTAPDNTYLGENGISLTPTLLASIPWVISSSTQNVHIIEANLEVGYHLRPASEVQGLLLDDSLKYKLGLTTSIGAGDGPPIRGFLSFQEQRVFQVGSCGQRVNPREVQAGVAFALPAKLTQELFDDRSEVLATVGLGYGLGSSPMTPDIRLLAGLQWGHQLPYDTDGDGLVDLEDGCPLRPEDPDGLGDLDGCPEVDHDQDSILDEEDRCPSAPETINSFEDTDGCPDEAPEPEQELEAEQVAEAEAKKAATQEYEAALNEFIAELRFANGKKTPLKGAKKALVKIADYLKARPHIERIRITGHTDSRGSAKRNLTLSRQRAEAVRDLLSNLGISNERMVTEGKGDQEPIAPNTTRKGRAQNRRIVMIVIEMGNISQLPMEIPIE